MPPKMGRAQTIWAVCPPMSSGTLHYQRHPVREAAGGFNGMQISGDAAVLRRLTALQDVTQLCVADKIEQGSLVRP